MPGQSNATFLWRYSVGSEDRDDDCRKAEHFATAPDGQRVEIDHSPYETVSPPAFLAHIALGFPPGPTGLDSVGIQTSAPWTNATILAAHAAQAVL